MLNQSAKWLIHRIAALTLLAMPLAVLLRWWIP